jgi:hypothetical protein
MEPLFDKLARQMPRYKRHLPWILWSVGISVLWWFIFAYCVLSTDDGHAKAHPFLDAASRFMVFPLGYVPVIESSVLGGIVNCLLWGFFLVWLFRLALRGFQRRRIV